MSSEARFGGSEDLPVAEISAEGLNAVVEKLVRLGKDASTARDAAQSTTLDPLSAEDFRRIADKHTASFDLGVSILDDLIPLEDRSWDAEIRELMHAPRKSAEETAELADRSSADDYPPEWVESHGRG